MSDDTTPPSDAGICTCSHPPSTHWHTSSDAGCSWHGCSCRVYEPLDEDSKRLLAIITAAHQVVESCGYVFMDEATGFSCDEADAIAALINACGGDADDFLAAHATGDDEGDYHEAIIDSNGLLAGWQRRESLLDADGGL